MSEKKNIVIKVKYPTSAQAKSGSLHSSSVITQWNYKRIGLALGSVFLILLSLLYFASNDKEQDGVVKTELALPGQKSEQTLAPQAVVETATNLKPDISKIIVRSQLTDDIDKNEPVNAIKLPLKIAKKETLWIYYFVEIKGMKGKAVYHEWLLNGDLISRKKVNISADPWRTASKQMITYTTNNDWLVRLVDEAGNKLNEKTFNLELK